MLQLKWKAQVFGLDLRGIMNLKSLIAVALVASPILALAQINPTGPFTGNYSEGFEEFPNYGSGGIYDTLSVFNGEGTFSSNPTGSNQLYIVSPANGANWGFANNGGLQNVADGVNALGSQNFSSNTAWRPADITLTFNNAVTAFGGYFAEDSTNSHFYLNFFDANGNLENPFGSTDIYQATNVMTWSGWTFTDPVKSIVFTDNFAPAMDGLQINAVPEPASIGALAIGMIALIRRRKLS